MRSLHHLLEDSARRNPAKIAFEDPERGQALSYRDADELSTRLARALTGYGVSAGDRVGVCARKSIASVTSLFGIMKTGAAYVPVDYAAPAKRKAYVFDDCNVRAVIAERSQVESLQAELGHPAVVEPLDFLKDLGGDFVMLGCGRSAALAEERDPALSYILYTSGSTGKPKGVIHTHASALSFVEWCSETFHPTADDRFSSHAPFHFDLSILDIYVPLRHGATLVLVGEEAGKHPARLAQLISDSRMTVWYSTPSILRLLLEYGKLAETDYSTLRLVFFAGEVFPVKYLRQLKGVWSHPVFFNLYGPTETNVCTYFQIPDEVEDDRVAPYPIGYTCENDRTRVISDGRDVAPGGEGELIVSGGSVMKGYWNLPERTAQAFMIDDGTRWYRTGDIVRDTGGGLYEFLGRRDRMVKRRGYRVELGEIETALHQHPDIGEAAVVALPDGSDGMCIRAFVAWKGTGRPSLVDVKGFCSRQLPLYMIPDQFVFQPVLPKTSTDKIDYQKLIDANEAAPRRL